MAGGQLAFNRQRLYRLQHAAGPGWAAVDVGSALLVVALMIASTVIASTRVKNPQLPDRLSFNGNFARLVLAETIAVYVVMVSGILVAGKGSITACLGWPIYNLRLFQSDGHSVANALRWIVSLAGIVLLIAALRIVWQNRQARPVLFKYAAWFGVVALLEALVQVLLLVFGHPVPLLISYTVSAALF